MTKKSLWKGSGGHNCEIELCKIGNNFEFYSDRVPVVMLVSSPEDNIVNVWENVIPVILVIQQADPQPGSLHSHHLTSSHHHIIMNPPPPLPGLT